MKLVSIFQKNYNELYSALHDNDVFEKNLISLSLKVDQEVEHHEYDKILVREIVVKPTIVAWQRVWLFWKKPVFGQEVKVIFNFSESQGFITGTTSESLKKFLSSLKNKDKFEKEFMPIFDKWVK